MFHRCHPTGPATRAWAVACALVVIAVTPAIGVGPEPAARAADRAAGDRPAAARVYRDRVEPHWFKGGTRFWYRNDLRGGAREFVLVDAAAGTRQPAFDHARAAKALADLTGRPVAADRLPVDALAFADDGQHVVLRGGGGAWRLRLDDYHLAKADDRDVDPPAAGGPAAGGTLAAGGRPRPSRRTGDPTTIVFQNRTRDAVDVYWMSTDGERRHYASVKPGDTWESNTYDGHVWLAADRDGNPLGVYEATRDRATAVIGGAPAATQPSPAGPAPDAASDATTRPTTRPADRAGGAAAADDRPRRRSRGGGARSPDGQWVVVAKDHNLYLRPRGDGGGGRDGGAGEDVRLTDDGKPDDAYAADRVWWSPDSTKLVAMQTVPAEERKVTIVESSPKDQLQPKPRTLDYLKPGDRVARPRPRLFDVAGGRRRIEVKEDLFPNPWSVQDVRWAADASRFTFVYNQRGHQVLRVVGVDAKTGEAAAVVDERSDTFVDYSGKYFCHWLGDDELLWASERDGWNHLYLYDVRAGRVKRQVTKGEWVVQGVAHVDEANRQVWFRAGGVRPGQDPYYTHFCRADLDADDGDRGGGAVTVLTEGDGTHAVQWKPGDAYFLDTYSRVDLPPVTEVRRSDTGALACQLEEADAADALAARGGRWPMRFVARGRDGKTDIHGTILFPRDFDPAKTYPVLENIYAGPQGFFAPKAFRASSGTQQRLADRGMIVVQCDGMGTSGRSKAFHDVCWQNLKDAGFPDRIAWIRAAAAAVPQMDVSRVGIYGGSAGGQNAMAALLWHHDFYKVAVADCGCHDNRMDKIWWNEQWMGWPVGPAYEHSSNVANAHLMQGKLMLVVGELDGNVDPASTFQAAGALQRAGKDFELVVVVGAGHGAAETPYGSRKRAEFLARHLLGEPR